MTNPTPHGQVPDALRLAEEITNLECSSEAVAKTIAAAADELCRLHVENASLRAQQPASPPAEQPQPHYSRLHDADAVHGKQLSVYSKPPAEQQAAKAAPTRTALPEGWTDCTIEFGNDGPEVVAYGPKRMMTRLAKWLGKYFAQVIAEAAPKAAPGEPSDTLFSQFLSDVMTAAGLVSHGKQCKALGDRLADMVMRLRAAPQQEAQEPVAWLNPWRADQVTTDYDAYGEHGIPLYTAPQPAPAPLSEMPYEKRKAIQEGEQIGASDAWFKARHEMLDTVDRRNVFRAGFDRGWNAALAAQGGRDAG